MAEIIRKEQELGMAREIGRYFCSTCGREFEEFSQFPEIDVLKVAVTTPESVPRELPRFSAREDLLISPTEGWRREFVPTEVLAYFNENPDEEKLVHSDNYIYYKPEGGENVKERRFYQRQWNDASLIKKLLEESSPLRIYLESLKGFEGKTVTPESFYPEGWEWPEFPGEGPFCVPGTEQKLFLSLSEGSSEVPRVTRSFDIGIWGHDPNLGSAGGATLALIFNVATIEYLNMDFYGETPKSEKKAVGRININDRIQFRLTPYGRKVYKDYVNTVFTGDTAQMKELREFLMKKIKPDEEGTVLFQLWEIMRIFGKEMYNGNPNQVFKDNQIIFPRF